MLRNGRLVWRLVGAVSVSIVGLSCVLSVQPLGLFSRPVQLEARRFIYRSWARLLTRVLNLRIRIDGEPPELPFVLVSNHLSYVDIVVLNSLQPARFVAKTEVASWPLLGTMCRAVDTIFVDRSSRRDVVRVGELIKQTLEEGEAVVLFPEGTSTNGSLVAGFRPSLLAPAAAEGFAVHAAALRYSTPEGEVEAADSVAWWGGAEFGKHIKDLLKLPYIDASISFAEAPIHHQDRKQLALELHRAVRGRFEPMTDQTMPPGKVPILPPPPLAPNRRMRASDTT